MIKNHIVLAWRNIKKKAGFSLINVGGLTIGIASCLLLLLYVFYHLGYDKQFKNIENIYQVENNQHADGKTYTFLSTPRQAAEAIKADVPGVMESVRVIDYSSNALLSYNDKHLKKAGLFADAGFFKIFSYHFVKGSPLTALTQPNSVVITQDLAHAIFGNDNPLGKALTRNGTMPLMVTGVIDDVPSNSTLQFDFVIPFEVYVLENPWTKTAQWGSNFCRTYVLLKSPAYMQSGNRILSTMVGKHSDGNTNQLFLYPFAKQHLYSAFENGKPVGGLIDQLHLFEVLAAIILLIACVNFMNLSTARSEERAKEVGIRKAIGSGRPLLILQFITEAVLMSVLATVAAIILVIITLPFFNQLLSLNLKLPYSSPVAWAILTGVALLTGVLSGSYPAFYLSSFEPIKVIKGVFKGGGSALSIRKVLVVIQFAFAVFLITATICIYRQIRFIQNRPTGYDRNGIVNIPIEGALAAKADIFINQLKSTGAITNGTGVSETITQNGNNSSAMNWPGKSPEQSILFDVFNVSYNFTKTAGVKLVAGREFSAQYPIDTTAKSVIINQTAAKIMNLKQPVGTVVHWGDQPMTIIGVYQDFVIGSPYQKVAPMMSTYIAPTASSALMLRLNPGKSIAQCVDQITALLKQLNPEFPPNIKFVDSDFARKFQNERMLAILANLFGGLAIVISCLGLFGLAAFAAEQRLKEIGVRKVLGASIMSIASLLSKDFLKLVAVAIVIAVPVSVWALTKWLSSYELRITLSWYYFVMAGVITLLIALLTVSYQAIKAAMANPIRSLRSE